MSKICHLYVTNKFISSDGRCLCQYKSRTIVVVTMCVGIFDRLAHTCIILCKESRCMFSYGLQ